MYGCPECGGTLEPVEGTPSLLKCPACGREAFVPDESADEQAVSDPVDQPTREDELSALRIRQFATAKRSAYRARSYAIIAAAICLVGVVQLAWMTVTHVRAVGWTPRPIGYVLFILLGGWATWYFGSRARAMHAEARRTALSEPEVPPDLSSLRDGSPRFDGL
jgi:hypothetical protein